MSAPPYTVQNDASRAGVRVLEALASGLLRAGLPLGNLEVPSILAAARRRTGLTDWGDDGFRVPMSRLLEEADAAEITALARIMLRQGAITAVANRLRLHAFVARNPEVLSIPIEKPLFILGFPRTGTTLLQNLLTLDEGERALQFWELIAPVPTHEDLERSRRRRMGSARAILAMAYFVAPEQRVIHEIRADSPEECWPLFQNRFSALNNDLATGFTGFGDWLLAQDMVPAYRDYRLHLQVLAHQQRTHRFVLKCPEHLWFLDALLRVFPDAGIVWTHRDPVDSVASYCSLVSLQMRNFYGKVDRERLGAHVARRFQQGVERAMAARARHPEARVYDVDFHTLVADPPETVRRIKEWHGMEHDAASDARVGAWVGEEREDGKGSHVYGTARYGLDADDLRRRFAPYIERFEIPSQRRARAG